MVSIAGDNRDIERSVQKIILLAQNTGAEFNRDLIVKCLDRSMSVEAPAKSAGQVLVCLPWDCLVPVPPFRLSLSDDDITISSCEKGLTSTSIALMEAVLELYNFTGKVAEHRRRSPCPLIAAHPQLLEYVVQRRGWTDPLMTLLRSATDNEVLLQSFFNTRAFTYYEGGEHYPPLPVLMPIIDLFNHHIGGAPYRDDRQAGHRSVSIRRSAPLPGTGNECFACYGLYDAFDTWITYDFVDGRVPFVRSIAMRIDLPGLGTIGLGNFFKPRALGDLPESVKDLRHYIPQLLQRRGSRIQVASLLIPGPQTPAALRGTLQFLLMEISPGHPNQRDLVLHAEEQILIANETYYRDLLACLRSLSAPDPLQKPIIGDFIRMCELQLARIQVYRSCAEG